MDKDFFDSLEQSVMNVGAEEIWKRTIGGRVIWFSPVIFTGQAKISDAMMNSESTSNYLNETKRVTLSQAIVGIDTIDLSSFRGSGPVFGPIRMPNGKDQKIDLPAYIYLKMMSWGSQFIDDCFEVYADLLEAHRKENLKEVVFEMSKSPQEELAELMVRVTELRVNLGLTPLVPEEKQEDSPLVPEREPVQPPRNQEEDSSFDPFGSVSTPVRPAPSPPAVKVSAQPPVHFPEANSEDAEFTSPSIPYRPSSDVIEAPVSRGPVAPPVFDEVAVNRNPRFSPPKNQKFLSINGNRVQPILSSGQHKSP
jgi:hypothetical protein